LSNISIDENAWTIHLEPHLIFLHHSYILDNYMCWYIVITVNIKIVEICCQLWSPPLLFAVFHIVWFVCSLSHFVCSVSHFVSSGSLHWILLHFQVSESVIEAVTAAITAMMPQWAVYAIVPTICIYSQIKWHVWLLTLVKHGAFALSYVSQ
jgi:hypothetical protein